LTKDRDLYPERGNVSLKCLIIAAGRGSRLKARGDSKPLTWLLGLTLIERVILTARSAGITDFYVVTGYNGEKVRQFLDGLRERRGINITHIINDEWEKGNGTSVLRAKTLLKKEDFILLMADHLFDGGILRRLMKEGVGAGEIVLAVDPDTRGNRLIDITDVTKVSIVNNRVIDIGKQLTEYNAFDTGLFLCSPAIFTAIETSIAQYNDDSLSGGVRVLAQEGKVRALKISEFWIDIDDDRAFQRAEKCLTDDLKKTTDGPVSRYLNRPLSIRITRYLVRTNITPNQISFFSFLLSVIAAGLFFINGYIPLVIGAMLAQISSVIDGCDGEVARLKYIESDFGGWFDAVLDRYADAFLLFGLTYHTFAPEGNIVYLTIGFLAIIGSFMNSYTADKYDSLIKKRIVVSRFRMGRDIRVFLIFIGALINQPFLTLFIIAVLMNVENIRRIVICYRHG
jgi:CDP-L-myo-inositol myo-inositolphosphotransferase